MLSNVLVAGVVDSFLLHTLYKKHLRPGIMYYVFDKIGRNMTSEEMLFLFES